jgi:circadian clock protein KaiC
LEKSRTGISRFDEITNGGLPKGRPTIICGGPGCGKTMFAMEFLAKGITHFNEPGVLMTFEETADDMARNVRSLGFQVEKLIARRKLFIDYVRVEPAEIHETGEFDLEGLFLRLQHAVDSVRAKRVVLDTLEAIFSGFSNTGLLRAEIRRLFRWLKDRRLTTVITAERGESTLTRYGLEEYVSDCVIALDHRVTEQVSTRRMRIVKYRGSEHGTNEYPFMIDSHGFSVLPISSMNLEHKVSSGRVSSGIQGLDDMLEGKGFFKGSSVLVSGGAGSGKSSVAGHFVDSACRQGKRALYIAFEECSEEAVRNMRSIGINLRPNLRNGLLQFHAWRPTNNGLEMHLRRIHKLVADFKPDVVAIDPMNNLLAVNVPEIQAMLMRLLDFLKSQLITAMFISLSINEREKEQGEAGILSLIDTWIHLRHTESNGELNRRLYILKARGMANSKHIPQVVFTRRGIRLIPAVIGTRPIPPDRQDSHKIVLKSRGRSSMKKI